MRSLSLALCLVACACVDPSVVVAFECDDGGHCTPRADGGSTGGGSATGGGDAASGGGVSSGGGGGQATGGGAAGSGGGAASCQASCTGCCDATGECHVDEASACGTAGGACTACGAGARCFAGACVPLSADGEGCSVDAACASGFCVQGLCCSRACTGACESCGDGQCRPRAAGTTVSACGAFVCDGVTGACPASCSASADCAAGSYCEAGTCAPLHQPGATCTANAQCSTGFCADGVCCDSACSGSCDGCNVAGQQVGHCAPSPSGDPGSPACGPGVSCNGALADCPILCASGCPTDTWCSGTYCSAKKSNGVTCGAGQECLSGQCADGVCCNSDCSGACDACSVATGAPVDGTCSLVGSGRVCRTGASGCDVEERCSGSSKDCPADAFADAGVACGTSSYSMWSTCAGAMSCDTTGTQSRTRTDRRCDGAGTCGSQPSSETQSCTRTTEGTSCGQQTFGAWSACSYANGCSPGGSRTRVRTDPLCQSGTCAAVQATETDTAGCARTTEGTSCGTASTGAWSACSYGTTCAESGSRTRSRTDALCQSGSCAMVNSTETDTTGCGRSTTGTSCAATQYGSWGACSYGSTCATSGTRTRSVTASSCLTGACTPSTSTESDTSACGRSTSGQSCGATQYGAWSACSYADTCTNSGSRTRTVTSYACDGSGGCGASTSTETDTAGCARNTAGASCGATEYGAWGACSYGSTCVTSGSRGRSVTTYTCGGGVCGASGSTETDTAGCARNTDGVTCGTRVCGNCLCPACERPCTAYACSAGACAPYDDSTVCTCGGACAIKAPTPTE